MECREKLETYLRQNGVMFSEQEHRRAYTAQQVAAVEHVPGRQVAKVVVVLADRKPVMMVIPAAKWLRLEKAAAALHTPDVRLANEGELGPLFPDCELGAMPPFGNLYDMPVYVDEGFAQEEEIVIQAGTHEDTMRVRYADFERLAHPIPAALTS